MARVDRHRRSAIGEKERTLPLLPVADRLSGLEVCSRLLAALHLNVVADLLAFLEALQPGALDGADMDEDVLAAAIRLNETEALLGVEPFDRACSHSSCPSEWAPECAAATLPDLSDAGNAPMQVGYLVATVGMSQRCLTNDFERECLARYATVHITLNLKLLLSGARQHLVDVGRPRRSREQRPAIRCNCRPGTVSLKCLRPRRRTAPRPTDRQFICQPLHLAAIAGALPVDGRAHH
jgi:hypothetical protein